MKWENQTDGMLERIRGGFWGLLVGDAVGVPYEFHAPNKLPSFDQIEMLLPTGFLPARPHIQQGTWSDDGAQALCLLDSLLQNNGFNLNDFASRIVAWKEEGLFAVDRLVFDVGNQTRDAIRELKRGTPPTESGRVNPNGKGNGALMRVLPLALWHTGDDAELIELAHKQAIVTHGHLTNQVCCALYCLWARRLMQGLETHDAYQAAVATLRSHYGESSDYRWDLENTVKPDDEPTTDGHGYVVSTLNAARLALREASYERVVKRAISFGHDTDTNAAVAGGLAGVRDGIQGIPPRWLDAMGGKELAQPLLDALLLHHS